MKKLLSVLLVLGLAAFLVPQGAGATTYYVDAVNGNDSNSGNSASSPWKSLNKVNASSFLPADKILFKRSQSWEGRLVIRSSGESSMPIIIGAYGAGNKPIIDGNSVYYTILLDGTSFIKILNLEIINNKGQGVLIYEGTDNGLITIDSCDIHNNVSNGITIKDRGEAVIRNCRIYANGRNGISVYCSNDNGIWSDILGHNVKLINNEIHDNGRHGVYLAGNNASIINNNIYANGSENQSHNMYLIGDNSIVESNKFSDAYNCGFRYEGSNMTFRYNFLKANYKHNLIFWNDYPNVMSNNKVYYNIFIVKKISDASSLSSMAIFVGKATNAGSFKGMKIYNNSIYAADDRAGGIWLEGCNNIKIKNNIINIGNGYLIYKDTTQIKIQCDYNLFSSTEILPFYTGRRDANFQDWQALGYDFYSLFTDPMFVCPTPEKDVDLALQENSSARGAGVYLALKRDYLGTPVLGDPDIGALQYQ